MISTSWLMSELLCDSSLSDEAHLILSAIEWHLTFPDSKEFYLRKQSTIKEEPKLKFYVQSSF